MTDKELLQFYTKFYEKDRLTKELQEFLDSRQCFLKNETKGNKELMYMAYDKIYTSTKGLMVTRQISEDTFFKLKEELSNIDRETV